MNRKTSAIPSLLDENSVIIESNIGKANALSSFFHSYFNYNFLPLYEFPIAVERNLPPEILQSNYSPQKNQCMSCYTLDASKSTGCDGVSVNMLKQTACSTALPLSNLLNLSLSTGKVPHEWKTSRITPIPKPGKDKKMTSGYRPISILPAASKIIEKHVKKILLDHLMTTVPISPRQWGFMESWSTISALIKVIDG